MRFDLAEEQKAIRASARDFLAARYPMRRVRELAEAGEYDTEAWKQVAGMGWPGLAIPEEHGGQGLGLVELSVLLEEFGYALAPSPFLSSVTAGLLIGRAGSDEQRKRWLPAIASGEAVATVGVADRRGIALVPDAGLASVLVIVDGDSARVVEGPVDQSERVETLDATRHFYPLESGAGEPLEGDVAGGVDLAEVALSAELVGIAQRGMEMAVDYAKVRQQFGRPIGAYQAVSHRCAAMLLETESARSATLFAAWAAGNDPAALPLAASVAKVTSADAGWHVTASALQVLGGIGFTWEHDLHFLLKRAKVDAHLLGAASRHRDRIAELSGLGARVPEPVGGLKVGQGSHELAERLVAALTTVHGEHPGHRAAHAKGTGCRGVFTATSDAARLTRAKHMQGETVPVTVRFSNGSGAPGMPDYARGDGRGIAIKFDVPGGEVMDMVGISLPVFFARNPEDFMAFLDATRRDPATNQPDMARLGAFLAEHPETQRGIEAALGAPLPASYGQVVYNSLHAFRAVDAAGDGRFYRWRLEPEAGVATVETEEARASGKAYLQDGLRERLGRGPIRFKVLFRLAEEGDETDDPTAPWPEEREAVVVGTLEVTEVVADQAEVEALVFDPTTVVDGIETSDDPILHARSGAYAVSFARRSGRTVPRAGVALGGAATVPGGAAVAPGALAAFDVDGARVAVANVDGALHAFQDTCSHRQCSLAEGRLEGAVVTCPCHGSRFDVTSGAVLRGPAKEPVRVYRAVADGEDLRLEV